MTSSPGRSMACAASATAAAVLRGIGSATMLPGGQLRDALAHEGRVARIGDDEDVAGLDERDEPLDRRLEQGPAAVEQGQERLRPGGAAERPQARAAPAGHDHGVHPRRS